MNQKSKSIFKKFITCLMVLVTMCITLFTNATTAFASELALDERTEYGYTGVSPHTGYAINYNIFVLKIDGKKVFCVEPGIPANSGEGYVGEAFVNAKKDILSKIAYYGYTNTDQTHSDYAVTQIMIFYHLGTVKRYL